MINIQIYIFRKKKKKESDQIYNIHPDKVHFGFSKLLLVILLLSFGPLGVAKRFYRLLCLIKTKYISEFFVGVSSPCSCVPTCTPDLRRPPPLSPIGRASLPAEGEWTAGRGRHSPTPRWQPVPPRSACCSASAALGTPPVHRQTQPKSSDYRWTGGRVKTVQQRERELTCCYLARGHRGRGVTDRRSANRWLLTFWQSAADGSHGSRRPTALLRGEVRVV